MSKERSALFLLPTDYLGGAERVLLAYAKVIAEGVDRVDVVIMSRGDQGGWRGQHPKFQVSYMNAASEKTGFLRAVAMIARMSYTARFRYAFSSHTHVNALLSACRGLRLLRTEFLITRESTILEGRFVGWRWQLFRVMYALFYGSQDLVICQTRAMRDAVLRRIPARLQARTATILNPVELSRLQLATTECPVSGPFIVTAGRLMHLKGVDLLIAAFASLARELPRYSLVVLGDGPDRLALEEQAAKTGLGERVRFEGAVANPFIYFRRAELGVVSSRREGFPNVLLEMMAACRRVVSTACAGDIADIAGLEVCEPGSAEALRESIRKVLMAPLPDPALFAAEIARRDPPRIVAEVMRLAGAA